MEQTLLYWWVFVALIVELVDGIFEWLRPEGFSSGVFLFAIVTVGGFIIFNKWSLGVDLRIQAIEKELGIEQLPEKESKTKAPWWPLLLWLLASAYLMGKSVEANGLAFVAGTAISGFILLIFAFGAYCLIGEAIRDYFRKPDFRKPDDTETDNPGRW